MVNYTRAVDDGFNAMGAIFLYRGTILPGSLVRLTPVSTKH